MELIDTPEAKAWIAQFNRKPGDEELARLLVGSLRLVSRNAFHQELNESIDRACNKLGSPLAVYAVRDVPEKTPYFPDKRRCPPAAGISGEVGSEGILANVATNLARRDPTRFLNHPPVGTLRRRGCREILLLDDLSGSGETVKKFLRGWLRTDSIRSWWSFGWLTFHVIAFAVSEQAEQTIRSALASSKSEHATTHVRFWYSRRPVAGPLLWPRDLQARLEDFCVDYGKFAKTRWKYYRGYRNSMGNLVLAHGCPNNVPGVFWHVSNSWSPLFPNRTVPPSLGPVFAQAGHLLRPSDLLTSLEANRLATDRVIDRLTPMGRNMVLVLVALRNKINDPCRLAQAIDLPQRLCDQVVGFCLTQGLIDQNRQLTPRGAAELRAISRLDRLPSEPPPLDSAFYFPSQLRGVRE